MSLGVQQSADNSHTQANGGGNPGALTISFSSLPTVGDGVIVLFGEGAGGLSQTFPGTISVTDNQGNTYTKVGTVHAGGASNDNFMGIWACDDVGSPSGTFTVSITYDWSVMNSGNGGFAAATIIECTSGIVVNAFGGTSVQSTAATTITGTTSTNGAVGDLCVSMLLGQNGGAGTNWGTTFTGTSTWAALNNQVWSFNGIAVANTLTNLGSAGTVSATDTLGGGATGNEVGMVVATFSPAGAPPPPAGNDNLLYVNGLAGVNLAQNVYIYGPQAIITPPPSNVVTVDNALNYAATSGTQNTFNFTLGQFANLLIFEWACIDPVTPVTPISVQYAGINLTKLTGTTKIFNTCATEIWFLANPPTGTNTLLYQTTSAPAFQLPGVISLNSAQVFGAGIAYAGATPATATGTATGVSTGGLYVSVIAAGCQTMTEGAGQTLEWSNVGFNAGASSLGDIKTSNGVFTYVGGGGTNANWAESIIGINVSGTGNQLPAAPTNLTATAGSGQVTLNWSPSTLANTYNVYQGTVSGGESATPILTNITGTSTVVTGLANGTTYFFNVTGVNAAGVSPASNEASATPGASLGVPSNLAATAGNASVSLTWTAASGAASYNVYQGTTSNGESSTPIQTGITSPSVLISSGLTNGTTYYFKVAAVNGANVSAQSNEASATPSSGGGGGGGGGGGAYDGVIAISGNQFVNGHGLPIKLHGANASGLETKQVQHAGCAWCESSYPNNVPFWSFYNQTLGCNVMRLPLNSASFFQNHQGGYVGSIGNINFTGNISQGQTSATLTSPWGGATGHYPISTNGNSPPGLLCFFTNGQTSCTMVPAPQNMGNGGTVLGWANTSYDCDPYNSRAAMIAAIQSCRQNNMYVDFDLHWDGPSIEIGGVTRQLVPAGQGDYMNNQGLIFWQQMAQWLATTFGSPAFNSANGYNGGAAGANYNPSYGGSSGFGDIMFEMFNEPKLNSAQYSLSTSSTPTWAGGTGISSDNALSQGCWSFYYQDYQANIFFFYPNQIIGTQTVVTWLRQNNFTNVVICNPNQYAQSIGLLTIPSDPINQTAAGWHPYPATSSGAFNNPWPYTNNGPYGWIGSDNGFGTPRPIDIQDGIQWMTVHNIPLIITEDGDQAGPSFASPAAPHCAYMQGCADIRAFSYISWAVTYANPAGNNTADQLVTFDGTNTGVIQGQGAEFVGWAAGKPNSNVELDNQTGPVFTSGVANTFSHTIGSAANFLIVIWHCGNSTTAPDASSITCNGIALHELSGSFRQQGQQALSLWYLSGPPTGNTTIQVNTSTAATVQMPVAISFRNVNGNSPFGAVSGANGGGQTLSVTGSGGQQGGTYLCAGIMDATSLNLNYSAMGGNAPYQSLTQAGGGTKYIFDGFYCVTSTNGAPTWAMNGSGSSGNGWCAFMIPMNPGTTVVTPPVVPGNVTNLSAVAGNASATLSWSAATNALSYNVYQGTTSGGESSTPVNTTQTSLSIGSLANGQAYFWKVAGVNGAQVGPLSSEVSATPTSGTGGGGGISGAISNPGGNALFVNSAGRMVNGAGTQVQLYGWNSFGYETTAIQGWDYLRPDQGGQQLALRTQCSAWHANLVRFPINQASWMGSFGMFKASRGNSGWTGWTWETPYHRMDSPDPGGNWFTSLNSDINFCTSNGIGVLIDMHWTMPGDCSPQQQVSSCYQSGALQVWQQIAQYYQGNRMVIFELFNEPITNFGSDTTAAWQELFQPGHYAAPGEISLNYGPPYNETLFSLDVSNVVGVFFPGDTISQNGGPQNMHVESFDRIIPQIHYTNPGNFSSSTPPNFVPGSISKTGGRATDLLISNNLAYFTSFGTSSGTANNIHSSDYTQQWVSATGAQGEYVYWNFTALFAANTANVNGATAATVLAFCWFCDGPGGQVQNWDAVGASVPVNAPATITVQISNQPINGNPTAPNNVAWNTHHVTTVKTSSGMEVLQVQKSGIQSVRFLFGGAQTGNNLNMKMDIYDVTTGFASGVMCLGDDLTAGFAGNLAMGSQTGLGIMGMIPVGGFITGATVGSGGSGYPAGTYTGVPLTGGNGTNAVATITVNGSGNVSAVQIDCKGYQYNAGNSLGWSNTFTGGSGSGGAINVSSVQGTGYYGGAHTPVMNCGQVGWTAVQWANYITTTYPEFIQNFWGRYVVIELGTNDFNNGVTKANFIAALTTITQAIRNANKIPCVCSLPFNQNGDVSSWNTAITAMLGSISGAIAGPDLYTFTNARRYFMPLGVLSFTNQGLSALRSEYANYLCAQTNSASCTITTANRGPPVADYTTIMNAIRGVGAANILGMGCPGWSNFLDQWLNFVPTDTVTPHQICATWHPYAPGQTPGSFSASGSGSGTATVPANYNTNEPMQQGTFNVNGNSVSSNGDGSWMQTNLPGSISGSGPGCSFTISNISWNNKSSNWSVPANWPTALNIHNSGYPLILTETGDNTAPGQGAVAPWVSQQTPWLDQNKVHVTFWSSHLTQTGQANILCLGESASGDDSTAQSPSPGYGQFVFNWMTGHAGPGTGGPAVPGPVGSPVAIAGSGAVGLTWTAATNATSYNIYQGTSAGGESGTPVASTTNTSISIAPLNNGTKYYFKIAGVDSTVVGPQSAEVSATPFAATAGSALTVNTTNTAVNTFVQATTANLAISVSGGNLTNSYMNVVIQNEYGATIQTGIAPLTNGSGTYTLPTGTLGYYRCNVSLTDGTTVPALGLSPRPAGFVPYAVVVNPANRTLYPASASRFGCQGGWSSNAISVIPLMGWRWFLNTGLTMTQCETSAGLLAGQVNSGSYLPLNIVDTITYGGNAWQTYEMDDVTNASLPSFAGPAAGSAGTSNTTNGALNSAGIADFPGFTGACAKTMVHNYPNQNVRAYQITWEPDNPWSTNCTPAQLLAYYQNSYSYIHAQDPNALVIGPTYSNYTITTQMTADFSSGMMPLLDGYAIHPYGSYPPETNGMISNLTSIMNSANSGAGKTLKFWATEKGFTTDNQPNNTTGELGQAQGDIRNDLILLGLGFQVTYDFYIADFNPAGSGQYGYFWNLTSTQFGTPNIAPKIVAPATAFMTYLLDGCTTQGQMTGLSGTQLGFRFVGGSGQAGNHILAIWDYSTTSSLNLTVTAGTQVTIYTWMGVPTTITSTGTVSVSLPQGSPVYVVGAGI